MVAILKIYFEPLLINWKANWNLNGKYQVDLFKLQPLGKKMAPPQGSFLWYSGEWYSAILAL